MKACHKEAQKAQIGTADFFELFVLLCG